MVWKIFSVILPLAATASALTLKTMPPRPSIPEVPVPEGPFFDVGGKSLPPLNQTYYFDQLIDHNNPRLGTFKQRYWHTWEFYRPGGPIVLMTPGESNAAGYTGYLTNKTVNGQIAQQEHGATIVIEHRFFGLSNPIPDLTDNSLRLLTIQQSIDDLEYFAKNVKLPMPGGDKVKPKNTPWILIGGSYSGALTAWTMTNKPGLFAAGYASSGVVEAISNFWQYFEPIRQAMPANCSADVQAVIGHFDKVFSGKNTSAINDLKAFFGMGEITHLDDVVSALKSPIYKWQDLQPSAGPHSEFFDFCDALDVKDGVSASAHGWGLDHALAAWANHFKTVTIPDSCGDSDIVDCLGSYDATQEFFTSTEVDNFQRSWYWFVCNEVGWFQESAPVGHPTLVSRLVGPSYDERVCSMMFPKAFPKPIHLDVSKTNRKYKGFDTRVNHLFVANGKRDPWRESTLSAESERIRSTSQQTIVLSDGFHCTDLKTAMADLDPTIKNVQVTALKSMRRWLLEWRFERGIEVSLPGISIGIHFKKSPKWGRDVVVEAE